MLHSMTLRLIHVDQLETLYLCYGATCQSAVIWGHWSQKVSFTKNAIICLCYIEWTIRFRHVDQLETLYQYFGVTCQSGVI